MSIEVLALTGDALEAALDDVARLRIAVFRAWPYLYDGHLDYERRYLENLPGRATMRSSSVPSTMAV